MSLLFLGEDLGMGANKLFGAAGGLQTPSYVSVNGGQRVARILGLGDAVAPLQVRTASGAFYIGDGAHDWGRPVENLDYDRLSGSPEMVALFYGSLTRYIQLVGPLAAPLSLTVGLPLEVMTGSEALATVEAVRRWMKGQHSWEADGVCYRVSVAEVKATTQDVGALFDYLLDQDGQFLPGRREAFAKETGIVSIGFNTLELLVVRDRAPVQRFTAGSTSGVRRLLEIVNHNRLYSLGELDARLRSGQLDVSAALPVWEREVTGVIERQWGAVWRRFAAVLLVGGGALLLKNTLPLRFAGKAVIPEEPVMAVARGLYKFSLLRSRQKAKA